MRYYLLFASIALGTYAAAALATSLAVVRSSPYLRRRIGVRSAAERARILATARLLPIAVGTLATLVLSSVFLRYEPRDTVEVPGLLLVAFALFGIVLFGAAAGRLVTSWRASVACTRLLQQCGRPWSRPDGQRIVLIDSTYPVAAVTGLFRTRLLISARIVRECTPRELEAVIRHEAAHVHRRDNLVRAAMRCLPDPLLLLKAGRGLQADWAAAAEEAADDEAAGPRVEARTELAAALVRVARMAQGAPPQWMPGLAFYEGTNLENRVRRLLRAGTSATATSAMQIVLSASALATGALLFAGNVSLELHNLMELAVRYLP
ncbi:MAG: M48 family metalloprotease [Acidobacteriota bacterium]|nr:M48 family metalloprotease [Acidobacteriota bacterium]MDQ3419292.1 M48 family metalloprotease [Acidobacteriota bacterium]